jgi:hypothetical protein
MSNKRRIIITDGINKVAAFNERRHVKFIVDKNTYFEITFNPDKQAQIEVRATFGPLVIRPNVSNHITLRTRSQASRIRAAKRKKKAMDKGQ